MIKYNDTNSNASDNVISGNEPRTFHMNKISYTYSCSIVSKLFNYKQCLQDWRIANHEYDSPPCSPTTLSCHRRNKVSRNKSITI